MGPSGTQLYLRETASRHAHLVSYGVRAPRYRLHYAACRPPGRPTSAVASKLSCWSEASPQHSSCIKDRCVDIRT